MPAKPEWATELLTKMEVVEKMVAQHTQDIKRIDAAEILLATLKQGQENLDKSVGKIDEATEKLRGQAEGFGQFQASVQTIGRLVYTLLGITITGIVAAIIHGAVVQYQVGNHEKQIDKIEKQIADMTKSQGDAIRAAQEVAKTAAESNQQFAKKLSASIDELRDTVAAIPKPVSPTKYRDESLRAYLTKENMRTGEKEDHVFTIPLAKPIAKDKVAGTRVSARFVAPPMPADFFLPPAQLWGELDSGGKAVMLHVAGKFDDFLRSKFPPGVDVVLSIPE